MKNVSSQKSISILGCGWLGLPLAKHLLAHGYQVKGSTTSSQKMELLKKEGISPFFVKLPEQAPPETMSSFLHTELLIINYPPGIRKSGPSQFIESFKTLLSSIKNSAVQQIIFLSSTSVYPNTNSWVDEDLQEASDTETGLALLDAERQVAALSEKKVIILRMAGLIGYDRQPARFFAGKKNIPNSREVVNLIHRDDCLHIIMQIIEKGARSGVYNCCSDTHPLKQDFYQKSASLLGLEIPEFGIAASESFKIVANQKLKDELGYEYVHSDLSQFDWQ